MDKFIPPHLWEDRHHEAYIRFVMGHSGEAMKNSQPTAQPPTTGELIVQAARAARAQALEEAARVAENGAMARATVAASIRGLIGTLSEEEAKARTVAEWTDAQGVRTRVLDLGFDLGNSKR